MRKVLVANRGEIAIRAFRAAYELGLQTVAVYTRPDRPSLHRLKADEAYEIGPPDRPLAGYLDVDAIVATAEDVGADAIYPGYGFLSENPALARACVEAGLTFIGPPSEVLELTGNKVRAKQAAIEAGLPVLEASPVVTDAAHARAAAVQLGFPLFIKASAGGGGRGLRLVADPEQLEEAVGTAMREAAAAFGDGSVFLERAVVEPRHIEVQVLADAGGAVVHLYERDCSVQRRHQKVVEIAPAPNLSTELRDRLCADAVEFARTVGYRNAGTVEFLVDADGRHVFIEMNPRIQVEHTVTEEVTGVDLVQAQMLIADGATHAELGIDQDAIVVRGCALQTRITSEDPADGFRPDVGRILAFRAAGGAGIRVDAGSVFPGAEISPYFDSLLVKVTSSGADLQRAARRADRALAEFRIRGVATNIGFLRAVLADPDFQAGRLSTAFVDDRPHLTAVSVGQDRATRLLRYLADVTVNRPHGPPPNLPTPVSKLPPLPQQDLPAGSRDRLRALGPDGFARHLRDQTPLAVTDTTLRDAHQSLLATRMRTFDMAAVARHLAGTTPQLLSLELWGGATFDVALRFLHEDPWDRLAALREAIPNLCLQMLLRGQNAVGYTRYPATVVRAFVAEAAATGVDIFRIFDALNDVDQMRPAIDATLEAGALAEGTVCYTGDLSDPTETVYTLDHYLRVAEQLVTAGVHVLCIKDMAGLLRAPAADRLVRALRDRFDLPVHLHTHDTAGGQLATYHAAVAAGVDAVDGAAAPLSGMTSQPSLAAIVAATDHTPRATGLDLAALIDLEPYWETTRRQYAPFDAGLAAPSGAVYRHEIPGGQLSNLRQQAIALGLGDRFEDVGHAYACANAMLGDLIKVTPTSKVVGDLALYLVSSGNDPDKVATDPAAFALPASVVGFLRGDLGTPPGGWPEPFRTRALASDFNDSDELTQLSADDRNALAGPDRRVTLTQLLFPGPAADLSASLDQYGDLSVLPTPDFLYGLAPGRETVIDLEPGVRIVVELEAVGDADERGRRTVLTKVNGQSRPIEALDRSITPQVAPRERADPGVAGHLAATFTGVVTIEAAPGQTVVRGDRLGIIEAMKMESPLTARTGGRIARIVVASGTQVEPGDLLLVVEEE